MDLCEYEGICFGKKESKFNNNVWFKRFFNLSSDGEGGVNVSIFCKN